MDDNTAFVWLMGSLFAAVALVRIVYWISWGVVNRAREHTKHLQIEAQERVAKAGGTPILFPSEDEEGW